MWTQCSHVLVLKDRVRSDFIEILGSGVDAVDGQVQGAQVPTEALLSQRPRDALCLSVVSFNSTKRRVESFIVSYVGYRFITAYN